MIHSTSLPLFMNSSTAALGSKDLTKCQGISKIAFTQTAVLGLFLHGIDFSESLAMHVRWQMSVVTDIVGHCSYMQGLVQRSS